MRATLIRSLAASVVCSAVVVGAPATAWSQTPPECGADWTRVPSPSPGTIYSVLLDVAAPSAGDAWAVGFRAYIDPDDQYAVSPMIERWDGESWTLAYEPDSQGQLAGAIALASDDVWAVGHTGLESPDYQPLIMHWNGSNWRKVSSPSAAMGYLTAIGGTGPDDLWAAGTLIGTFDTIVEHWDGEAWTLVAHPSPTSDYVTLGGVAARGTDDVTIVGTYLDSEGKNAPLALHWNGTSWRRSHPQSVGELGTSLLDATSTNNGRVWVVGSYATDSGGTQAVAQRLGRHGWVLATPPSLPGSGSLASVGSGPGGTWAVGSRVMPDERPATLIERWRPLTGWRPVSSPEARGDNYLLGVDVAEGETWAVGFHRAGIERTLTEHRCG